MLKILDRIWNGKPVNEPTTAERLDRHASRLADKLEEIPEDERQWAVRQLLLKEIQETESTVQAVNEANRKPPRRKHWWQAVTPDTWAKLAAYAGLTLGGMALGYKADKDGTLLPKWAQKNNGNDQVFKL